MSDTKENDITKIFVIIAWTSAIIAGLATIAFFGWWAMKDRLEFGHDQFNQVAWITATSSAEKPVIAVIWRTTLNRMYWNLACHVKRLLPYLGVQHGKNLVRWNMTSGAAYMSSMGYDSSLTKTISLRTAVSCNIKR
jgi:hypothetical protein